MDRDVITFFAIDAGVLFLGFLLGGFWFSTVALPMLYAVPRAAWWASLGRLRWRIVPLILVSPILWSALFAVGAVLLIRSAPEAAEQLYSSVPFFLGLCLGIGVRAFRALGSKSGRQTLHDRFLDTVRSHFKRKQPNQEAQGGEDIHQRVWHLSRGGRHYGPFTYDELQRRAARGEMQEDDLLWRPGVTEWVEASVVLGPAANSEPPR